MDSALSILYEDEDLIAINKLAGHLVHPADEPQPDDIVSLKLVREHVDCHIYTTHRLDRPTCGVLIFAKHKTAARAVGRAFERKLVSKHYLAGVAGYPNLASWNCTEPLRKTEEDALKDSETKFTVIKESSAPFSLIKAEPATGRYHQIRKHLLHCGHPIIGDYRYAGIEQCEDWSQKLGTGTRMLLQCHHLTLSHPGTKEMMTITAPSDPLFEKLFSLS